MILGTAITKRRKILLRTATGNIWIWCYDGYSHCFKNRMDPSDDIVYSEYIAMHEKSLFIYKTVCYSQLFTPVIVWSAMRTYY